MGETRAEHQVPGGEKRVLFCQFKQIQKREEEYSGATLGKPTRCVIGSRFENFQIKTEESKTFSILSFFSLFSLHIPSISFVPAFHSFGSFHSFNLSSKLPLLSFTLITFSSSFNSTLLSLSHSADSQPPISSIPRLNMPSFKTCLISLALAALSFASVNASTVNSG